MSSVPTLLFDDVFGVYYSPPPLGHAYDCGHSPVFLVLQGYVTQLCSAQTLRIRAHGKCRPTSQKHQGEQQKKNKDHPVLLDLIHPPLLNSQHLSNPSFM